MNEAMAYVGNWGGWIVFCPAACSVAGEGMPAVGVTVGAFAATIGAGMLIDWVSLFVGTGMANAATMPKKPSIPTAANIVPAVRCETVAADFAMSDPTYL